MGGNCLPYSLGALLGPMNNNPRICSRCGNEHKRGGQLCPRCYTQSYRTTPSGKQATRKALKRYGEKYQEKRAQWVETCRSRVCYYTPGEVHDLRAAVKRLEQAVVVASDRAAVHEPG